MDTRPIKINDVKIKYFILNQFSTPGSSRNRILALERPCPSIERREQKEERAMGQL